MPIVAATTKHSWWADLRHGGLLISPPLLDETFPDGPVLPSERAYDRLRDRFNSFGAWLDKHGGIVPTDAAPLHVWLDDVLEEFLGYEKKRWQKGSSIPHALTVETFLGERLRPNRVLMLDEGRSKPALAVFVDRSKRVGLGRGRTAYSKLIEFLRGSGLKLGLLTNGSQFRLCYAGLDHDSWTEWDADTWFDEGELRYQLYGFLTLLGPLAFASGDGGEFPLLKAVQASRTRQGELSSVLGEQVRQAVELLLIDVERASRRHPTLLDCLQTAPDGSQISRKQVLDSLYQAASRVVMRMVVILFAEARGLLPRSLQTYNSAYGLEGLFEQLRRAMTHEGYVSLNEHSEAWPRIVSLFNLIHEGSSHPHLPVPAYGGLLFRTGKTDDSEQVQRAVSVFEDPRLEISDATILRILDLLKIGAVKIRRGRTSTMARGPVDFSQLRTEYIGILYEGLLDYELKSADKAMIFLNLGQQPILPLDILENMSDADLKNLLDKLGKEKASGPVAGEEGESGEEEAAESVDEAEESENIEAEAADEEISEEDTGTDDEEYADTRTEADVRLERALNWAVRAAEVAGLVRKPRGRNANLYQYEKDKQAAARRLIVRVLDQGEFYLARWGGTRKGSGTFYTKPGLAVPTVHRTLEPLAYDKSEDGKLIPKAPEDILAIKVCDPACGSGSFLVAALNYLTEALYQSLLFHRRIREAEKEVVVTLPFGKATDAGIAEETLPVPSTDERFEAMLKARLKRHVVERCIYGVDLNPMAVELCRLSLWVETMDPTLPFGFLDHKIKCGNALVGCWFDRFLDYPVAAWLRKGGDENHTRGVHFEKEEWSKRIKAVLNERVKPELVRQIEAHQQPAFGFVPDARAPETLHEEAVSIFEKLHSLSVATPDGIEQREQLYRRDFMENPKMEALREAFDLWCSVWFWPADHLGDEAPTPMNFYDLSQATKMIVQQLRDEMRFFHWELEFPDAFAVENAGFDALVGNPPWEISKPNSKEFFSNYDPVYRTYGKREALAHQVRLFQAAKGIEREWLSYSAAFKAMSNWVNGVANAFGDPESELGDKVSLARGGSNASLHDEWRHRRRNRRGYADPAHPFRYQGSADINTYKMFLELSYRLARQGSGRLGFLLSGGFQNDLGAYDLRQLLLPGIEYLVKADNERGFFNGLEHNSRFNVVICQKDAEYSHLEAVFSRMTPLSLLENPPPPVTLQHSLIRKVSPYSLSIPEVRDSNFRDALELVYDNSTLISELGTNFVSEFHMTNDHRRFRDDGELPLYQGAMIWHYDHHYNWFVSEQRKWHRAKLEDVDFRYEYPVLPRYRVPVDEYLEKLGDRTCAGLPHFAFYRLAHRVQSSLSNQRTFISTIIPWMSAAGNSLALYATPDLEAMLLQNSVMSSFVFDFVIRTKTNSNINKFSLDQAPIPTTLLSLPKQCLIVNGLRLICTGKEMHTLWQVCTSKFKELGSASMTHHMAVTAHERRRLMSINDALAAYSYGIDERTLSLILAEFSGVGRMEPVEIRHTTLVMAAFRDLKELGLEEFCRLPDPEGLPGCGWQIPEKLTFAVRNQGIIEFNASDGNTYTVRERLGPRVLPWQLDGAHEESWAEYELQARNILGEAKFKRLMAQLSGVPSEPAEAGVDSPVVSADGHAKLFATGHPNLFGEDTTTKMKRGKN